MYISRHAPGVKRFNYLITLSIALIFIFTLLISLGGIQSRVEEVKFKSQVMNIRLQLRDQWGHRSASEQTRLSTSKEVINPFSLLKPYSNYMGEYATPLRNAKSVWYFDTTKKQLVYIFKNGNEQRYKLVNSVELITVQ